MEIRQLEHFVAAVETGTLRGAAEQSNISQPGLSMSLARLEEFLGAKLLERKPRGVTPTPHGDALYRHAKIVLAHLRHATGEIDALRGDGTSELRLGVGASFMNRALPRVVAKLLTARPGFTLSVHEGIAEDQIPKLLDGELDLVLVRFPSAPPHNELIYETLHRRQLSAYVRADHRLARRQQPIALNELASERWIIPDQAPSEIAGPIFRALQRAGTTFRPTVQTNSVPFLTRLLRESDCIALLPEGAMADEVANGEMKALPLPEIDLEDEVGAVYRRELGQLPVLGEIISALREELPRVGLS
jgi:DNA-binding transcriptional LysR family regulator